MFIVLGFVVGLLVVLLGCGGAGFGVFVGV